MILKLHYKLFRMYSHRRKEKLSFPTCENLGEEHKHCKEKCSLDGTTCLLSINLDKCTCNGIHLKLQETVKYDFQIHEILQTRSKSSGLYGTGYATMCGDCTPFCSNFPGEQRALNSSQTNFSCL